MRKDKFKIKFFITIFMVIALNICIVKGTDETKIKNVPKISQLPELPTGCEATTATMLLKWAGYNVSKFKVADVLPKASVPYYDNGVWVGYNPNKYFIGDPYSTRSYGVYHIPIFNAMNKFCSGKAVDLTGKNFEDILQVVKKGAPVMAWSTIDLADIRTNITWVADGEKITWKVPEHTYLIIGFNEDEVILVDPMDGIEKKENMDKFKALWEGMGSQAITINSNKNLEVFEIKDEFKSGIQTLPNFNKKNDSYLLIYILLFCIVVFTSYYFKKSKVSVKKKIKRRNSRQMKYKKIKYRKIKT